VRAVADANIAVAALITQLLMTVIMIVGAFLIWTAEQRIPYYRKAKGPDAKTFGWVILLVVVFTIVPLILADAIVALWAPVFAGVHVPTVPTATAIEAMFVVDILGIATLVYQTGGSRMSAFSPLLFVLPALALFLQQSFRSVIFLSVLLFFAFWLLMRRNRLPASYTTKDVDELAAVERADGWAFWWITLLTLALTTIVAFIADPRWVRPT
jgi:hypothetical protein